MTLITTGILDTVVSMGLDTFRENIVLAKLVNRQYEKDIVGATKHSTVNVTIPPAMASRAVSPGVVPPSVDSVTPTVKSVSLSQWREVPFTMTDKDLSQVDRGIIPMMLEEAAKELANEVDAYLFGLAHGADGFYGYAGLAGTTPCANDTSALRTARVQANVQLMPMEPRFGILDPLAEGNALGLETFADASASGSTDAIVKGQIGQKYGALWAMSQNVPTHTTGAAGTALLDDGAGYAAGVTTVHMDGLTTVPSPGDVFTISGDTQTYIVVSASALVGTDTDVVFEPPLKIAAANDLAVTFKASHTVNLLLHRDAIAFVMAPLADTAMTENRRRNISFAIDNVSGLALRLEVSDQHKQTQWSLDALYGGKVIRRQGGVRIAG